MVNVYIKNMDGEAYKEAKKMAIEREENVGEVVSEAIKLLKRQEKHKKTDLKKLLGFLGKNELKASKETEELLRIRRESVALNKNREELHERIRHKHPHSNSQ